MGSRMQTPGIRLSQTGMVTSVASGLVILAFLLAYPLQASGLAPVGDRVVFPYVFLSVAIDYPPGECVGNFVLNMAALGLSASFVIRYVEMKHRLIHQVGMKHGNAHTLNAGAMWLAQFTVVGGTLGVTAVPWHVAPGPHLAFALTLFYGGGVYITLQCVLDWVVGDVPGVPQWVKLLRILCVVVGSMLMAVYVVCFGVTGQGTTDMYQEGVEWNGKTLMVFFAAAAELGALTLLMLHIFTYSVTQNQFELLVALQEPWEEEEGRGAADCSAEQGGHYKTFSASASGSGCTVSTTLSGGEDLVAPHGSGASLAVSTDAVHLKLPKIKTGREKVAGT